MTDMVDVPVRVINETDTAWLVTQRRFGTRGGSWLTKAGTSIPTRLEIRDHHIAHMPAALAAKLGLKGEMQ